MEQSKSLISCGSLTAVLGTDHFMGTIEISSTPLYPTTASQSHEINDAQNLA